MIDLHYKFQSRAQMHAMLSPLGMSVLDSVDEQTDAGIVRVDVPRVITGTERYAAWEVGQCKLPTLDYGNAEFFDRIPPQAQNRVRLRKAHPQFAAWEVGTDVAANMATAVHLNVRVVDPAFDLSSLDQFKLQPRTPDVVWA